MLVSFLCPVKSEVCRRVKLHPGSLSQGDHLLITLLEWRMEQKSTEALMQHK